MNTAQPAQNAYLDQALSFEMVKNLCSGKGTAYSELAKFILIIGMDQFKSLFKALTDRLVKDVQTMNFTDIFSFIISIFKTLVRPFTCLFTRRNTYQSQDCKEMLQAISNMNITPYTHSFETNIKFQKAFFEHLFAQPSKYNLTYTIEKISDVAQEDNNTLTSKELFSNINLKLQPYNTTQNITMYIDSKVEFSFITKNGKKSIKDAVGTSISGLSFTKPEPYTEEDCILKEDGCIELQHNIHKLGLDTRVLELLDEVYNYTKCASKFRQIFIESNLRMIKEGNHKIVVEVTSSVIKTRSSGVEKTGKIKDLKNALNISEFYIVTYKENKFIPTTPFSVKTMFFIYIFLCCIFIEKNNKRSDQEDDFMITAPTHNKIYQDVFFGFPCLYAPASEPLKELNKPSINSKEYTYEYTIEFAKSVAHKIKNSVLFKDENDWKRFINHLLFLNQCKPLYPDIDSPKESPKTDSMIVTVCSNDFLSQEALQQATFAQINALSSIQTLSSNTNSKIKTFDIKMAQTITKKQVKNPKYTESQAKLKTLQELPQNEVNSKVIAEFVSSMPPENITEETKKKEVVCSQINEVKRDINRLYLSKGDKHKLSAMLQDFRDDKDSLQDLGLPNKLCVLLYGEPGCGKSSTIETIGTFLQKDIYNVNLSSIKTNEDLLAIWDYVTNKTSKGGCIVMEDIDASTDVVLQRDDIIYTKVQTDVPEGETPLSLSTLLNVLQGSLTRDGSVVVVTTNYIDKLDKAFTRSMRFDVKIDMKPADHDQIEEIFKIFFPKRDVPIDIIKSIKPHVHTPAKFIDVFREYRRNIDVTNEELFSEFI